MSGPSRSPEQRIRLEAGVTHLHGLGARATLELLLELASPERVLDRLDRYRNITPALLRAVGGDRFPQRLAVLPDERRRA